MRHMAPATVAHEWQHHRFPTHEAGDAAMA